MTSPHAASTDLSQLNYGGFYEAAPAKLNLSLGVRGRREDGYHELNSLVCFTNFGDELKLEPGAGFKLVVDGPFAGEIEGKNLLTSMARALLEDLGRVDFGTLFLRKNIPVAAGLGGGSSDAAALIRLLSRVFHHEFSKEDIAVFGKRFGADVPACVIGRPGVMRGIGEIFEPVCPFPGFGVLLVNPLKPVLTKAVFKQLNAPLLTDAERGREAAVEFENLSALLTYMESHENDLLVPANVLEPFVRDVLSKIEALPGCLLARLSGSGATCFGVFKSRGDADLAREQLLKVAPDWWIEASEVAGLRAE